MDSFQIKLLACLFMLVDHTGVIIFPELLAFRVIGRLAFPLFAWSIANGFSHTRNVGRYFRRLFLFGLILQIPYSVYFRSWELNIFFTLSLGLLAIWLFQLSKQKKLGGLAVLCLGGIGEILRMDYGLYGVLTIFLFHLCRGNFRQLLASFVLLNCFRFLVPLLASQTGLGSLSYMDWIQPLSLVALTAVYFYNGQKGRSLKYLFYVFYPVHLLLLYGFRLWLQKA